MAFTIGIKASGSGTSEYMKKIVLKDTASYGPWRTKLTSILDAEDCMEIVGFRVTAGCRNICNLNKYSISRYSVERASVSERRV